MPSAHSAAYACSCLNVRITPASSAAPLPDFLPSTSSDFTPVYVADEGISIRHLQVTVRVRTRGELTSRNRRARHTSLICLVCQVLVYRVHQVVSLDADGRDGPLMPTETWVEQDILKSASGWIEVHKNSLTGDAILRAEASPQYSPLFSLTIPDYPMEPPPEQVEEKREAEMSYLEHLGPLFLPPPFTPGHPVFAHLAALAKTESDARRAAVERDIAQIIRAKSVQVAQSEALLRHQVELLYRKFREGLQSIEHADTPNSPASPRSPRSPNGRTLPGTPGSPTVAGTSAAADYGFTPLPVAPTRQSHQSAPRMSALSESLSTSRMHHPRAQSEQEQPPEPTSPTRTLTDTTSITLAASPHAPARVFDGGASLLHIGRNMNETTNTAASYRLFQDIEADMARSRQERDRTPTATASSSSLQPVAQASSSAGPSTVNGNRNGSTPHADEHPREQEEEASNVKGKGKQRKVVTFQSQPAVVTIQRAINAEKEEEAQLARNGGEEMIFDLETDNKGTDSPEGMVMTLVEQPPQPRPSQPRRTSGRKEPIDAAGLPQSFKALRPASLPAPSNMPRRRSSPLSMTEVPAPAVAEQENEEQQEQEQEDDYDSRDREILKLVAANIPSHRGAWKKGSEEWKVLVNRNGRRPSEDDEEDGSPPPPPYRNGIASSMPIAVRPLGKTPVRLSLASYREGAALPQGTAPLEPEPSTTAPAPSSSVRNSLYAERDMQRGIDPGALDFAVDNGTIMEEDENENGTDGADSGEHSGATSNGASADASASITPGRGREVALRILQARNELPDSDMFYSLAS